MNLVPHTQILHFNIIPHLRLSIPQLYSGFGGLEVAFWPLVPKFVGSNPVEAVEFFREKKSSGRLHSAAK